MAITTVALVCAVAALRAAPAWAAATATTPATTTTAATTAAPTTTTATTTTATLSPAPAQPVFIATGAVLKFTAGNTWTTTIQVMNPGPPTVVGLQVILMPRCVSVATTTQVTLNADGVTTIPVRFTGPDFSANAMSSATIVMVPAAQTIPASSPCADPRASLTPNVSESVGSGSLAPTPPTPPTPPTAATTPAAGTPGSTATVGTYTPQPTYMNIPLARITPVYYGFIVPLLLGAVLAAVVIAVIWWRVRFRLGGQDAPTRIKAGSTWNFKDSFATNVTAIGGLLGAALSALGSNSTLLPGIETGRFSLLAALWATVAVLTPLILSFGTSDDSAPVLNRHLQLSFGPRDETAPVVNSDLRQPATSVSYPLLLVCLFMTVLAAGAELTTFGVLASESATTHWIIYVCLIIFALMIAAYVIRTSVELITSQSDDAPPHSGLNHFRDTSLIG